MTERRYSSTTEREVTRMAKLFVAAAGGEIHVPTRWITEQRYLDLELEEHRRGDVTIYRTRWLRNAPVPIVGDAAPVQGNSKGASVTTIEPAGMLTIEGKTFVYAFTVDDCPGFVHDGLAGARCKLCGAAWALHICTVTEKGE